MDLYQEITDRIIAQLESGCIPWNKPWSGCQGAISHTTGKRYSLLNQILLGERSGEFITFKQCKQEGGHVRKGEKSSMVVFWKWLDKIGDDGKPVIGEDGKPEQVPYLRYYNVFHIDQCEGITAKYADAVMPGEHLQPVEAAEKIVDDYLMRSGVKLIPMQGDRAFYSPGSDSVTVPLLSQFTSISEYYSALYHELAHSTGHRSRLNRLDSTAFFGSESYSKEELIAEMSSAYLVNHVGLETTESFTNSAGYIQGWLKVLKSDKRFVVSAAGKAEKAVNYIIGDEL